VLGGFRVRNVVGRLVRGFVVAFWVVCGPFFVEYSVAIAVVCFDGVGSIDAAKKLKSRSRSRDFVEISPPAPVARLAFIIST